MKKRYIIILVIIILLQIILYVYLGSTKKGMHMDEAYSFGLMNYDKVNITEDEEFLNNWHNKEYFLDYLELNSDELWDLKQVYINQVNDVHPPLYYYLLRITALFNIDNFSMWEGIILNIIILAISTIVVFVISKQICNSYNYALLISAINAFSIAMMENAMFLRMYALLTLMILLYTWTTIKTIKYNKFNKKECILTSIILILGGLTHYYFFIYVLGTYIIIIINSLKNKNISFIKKYTILLFISAIIYLIIFPASINHVLFSERGIVTINSITFSNLLEWIKSYLNVINKNIFNYFSLIYILFISLIYIICRILEKKGLVKGNIVQKSNEIIYILFPVLFYFIIILIISPYKELRYILDICPQIIICIIYFSKILLERYVTKKTCFTIISILFLLITLSVGYTNNSLRFTFTGNEVLNEKIKNDDYVLVYLYQTEKEDRFLDNIYYFTLVDESYIMKKENFSIDKVIDIVEKRGKSSFILVDENKFTFYK